MSSRKDRLKGLAALVVDAVEHGSRAVERIQKETAATPFGILEQIPPIALPARVVHTIHDASVTGVHTAIRVVAAVTGKAVELAIDVADKDASESNRDEAGPSE